MVSKAKICSGCGRERKIWKSEGREKFCQQCWNFRSKPVPKPRKRAHRNLNYQSKTPYNKLEAQLDQLLRKYLLLTQKPVCYTCDTRFPEVADLQVGHYMSRRHTGLRWDLRNVRMQCQFCNETLHSNHDVYTAKLDQEQPGLSEELNSSANLVNKFTISDLRLLVDQFKNLIDEATHKQNQSTTRCINTPEDIQ